MSDVPEVDPAEAQALVEGGALLLDVREDDEWAAARAPGAVQIRLGTLLERLEEIPRERKIVAVCRRGSRSMQAANVLVARGYDVVNLAGGMQAWSAAGMPMLADDGAPRVI